MNRSLTSLVTMLIAVGGCARSDPLAPPTVYYGQDVCAECGMIVSDERFAAAAIVPTDRGYVSLVFDDVGCLLRHDAASPGAVRLFVRDFRADRWLTAATARFVHSRELRTPMASGVAAAASPEEASGLLADLPGEVLDFAGLRERFAAGALGVSEHHAGG